MNAGACPPLPVRDLDAIVATTAPLWDELRGERLLLTGGTGFFGCWLVESFVHAERTLALNAHLTVLSRDPSAFLAKMPHLRDVRALTLLAGDVRTFRLPAEPHAFIIHGATNASAKQTAEAPREMLSTIVDGTAHVLRLASAGNTKKLLFVSSGAVYGPQPPELKHLPESYRGAPDPLLPASVYGEGKRAAELMCALAANDILEVKIARPFAFLGPHLPLDRHFAAGNFLADALAGRTIQVAGDGSSVRSYLYAADLATWLWTILFRAPSLRAFNVGSEEAITVSELARTTALIATPRVAIEVAQPQQAAALTQRYVPATVRANAELGLRQTVPLADALERTRAWHRLK